MSDQNAMLDTNDMNNYILQMKVAQEKEKIVDLLVDKVITGRYVCPYDTCRKTFDHPSELFCHAKMHVKQSFPILSLYRYSTRTKNFNANIVANTIPLNCFCNII